MKNPLKELTIEIKPSRVVPGEVGLFAARDIEKGDLVVELSLAEDDFVSNEEFAQLSEPLQEKVRAFAVGVPGKGFSIARGLDYNRMPITYFLNHCCEGNLGFNADGDLVALRDISRGEELHYDYGLVEANPEFSITCNCGTQSCRGKVTGLDWKNPEFQKRNWSYMDPELKVLAQ